MSLRCQPDNWHPVLGGAKLKHKRLFFVFYFLLPQNLFMLLSNTCKPSTCFLYIFSAFFKLLQLFLKKATSVSPLICFLNQYSHFRKNFTIFTINTLAIFNFFIGSFPALDHSLLLFHSITGVFLTEHTWLWLQVLGYFKTGNWCHFYHSLPPTSPSYLLV